MVRTLNLGILAHVDAGKTSLTERLLYDVGVIAEIGSVDAGSTQTDTLALERRRGITIKSAVVSFTVDDVTVNLVDTPGHPDFIAEVERVLSVLDAAVLVISAVEGVQAQTRVLFRTLQRLAIPTVMFVNKIDRAGADPDRVLASVAERLTTRLTPVGTADRLGTPEADFVPYEPVPVPAAGDHPVYFGSAMTGAGVASLLHGLTTLSRTTTADAAEPPAGSVFKVERGAAGEKIAYVRVRAGGVRTRQRLSFVGRDTADRVTAVAVFDAGSVVRRDAVLAGEIGKLWGLDHVQVGDTFGPSSGVDGQHWFPPPTLETVVEPLHPDLLGRLHQALAELAEQDPLIGLRQDDVRRELSLSLYGEVQKEVIEATLADDYGLAVTFRDTTPLCIEQVVGTGAAVEYIGEAPFRATVGLRVEPTAADGVEWAIDVELGSLPLSFMKAVEETVVETLHQGLYGWAVTGARVVMTHSAFTPPPSTAGDFRNLTPLVVMEALRRAGTRVCEPLHALHLELPADTLGPVLSLLARLGGVPLTTETAGDTSVVDAELAAAQVHEVQRRLAGLTRGEGVLEARFDRYEPVRGRPPRRERWDHNPLNRKQYLQEVARRTQTG